MQSFKQFLTESQDINVYFRATISFERARTKKLLANLERELSHVVDWPDGLKVVNAINVRGGVEITVYLNGHPFNISDFQTALYQALTVRLHVYYTPILMVMEIHGPVTAPIKCGATRTRVNMTSSDICNSVAKFVSVNSLTLLAPPAFYTRPTKGLLWLFKVKDLEGLVFNPFVLDPGLRQAIDIIKRYITKKERDVLACQEELIEAGLEEYADF